MAAERDIMNPRQRYERAPKGQGKRWERVCPTHGQQSFRKSAKGQYRCPKCVSDWQTVRRQKLRRKLVEMAGGKCKMCGYSRSIAALHFHHRDPKEKKFALAMKGHTYAWARVVEEAAKCDLLCANCHTELHNPESITDG